VKEDEATQNAQEGSGGPTRRAPFSVFQERLLELHKLEGKLRNQSAVQSKLVQEFPDLLDKMPDDAVPHVRAKLDGGLVFRQDGSAADLRSIVFEQLCEANRSRVLARIRNTCLPPTSERRGFVVLSDVDDTLLPGRNILQMDGSDRSWHLDGRLYPGVSKMHAELRGGLRDAWGDGDYSGLLTARPPMFMSSLARNFPRIAGKSKPRMAILPGQGGVLNVTWNAVRVLAGRYSSIGKAKVARLREYAQLFPDLAGRFVFIGDDGQADMEAAEEMLDITTPGPPGCPERRLVAFVAVHAVCQGELYAVPFPRRQLLTRKIRQKYPAVPWKCGVDGSVSSQGPRRHRFFYFENYWDLARQLVAADWIEPAQAAAIERAARRDELDLAVLAAQCDLRGLRSAFDSWSESRDEFDEVEKEAFELAGECLPHVLAAHLRLAIPVDGVREVVLQVRSIRSNDGQTIWPAGDVIAPVLRLRDTSGNKASGQPPATSWSSAPESGGALRLPWPCETLCRNGARAALNVDFGRSPSGRCFVLLDEAPGALRDGSEPEVHLVRQDAKAGPARKVGDLNLRVHWIFRRASPRRVVSGASRTE